MGALHKNQEAQNCFQMITSSYCDTLEAKEMSTGLHGAGKQHLCIKGHSMYENMVVDKRSLSQVKTEKM